MNPLRRHAIRIAEEFVAEELGVRPRVSSAPRLVSVDPAQIVAMVAFAFERGFVAGSVPPPEPVLNARGGVS